MIAVALELVMTAALAAQALGAVGGDSGLVHVAVGFGVDTSRSPDREIFRLWRAYLSDRPDSVRPSRYWSRVEQLQYPAFDLLGGYVFQGFPNVTVVELAPSPGMDSTYVIRTLIGAVFDSARDVKPLALFRVYAVREDGRWTLANALPRLTRNWKRERIGPITFIHPPIRPFDRSRAQGSAKFVDSLARAFALPVPDRIGYYFTDNLADTFRAWGLDFFPLGSDTAGGRAQAANQLILVGSSTGGEDYRHELAHVVLAPLAGPLTHGLVSEGLATWTGGSAGLSFPELVPGLRRWVEQHPAATLDSMMVNPPMREGTLDVGYGAFAVLCQMVFEQGGVGAIRQLAAAGTSPGAVLGAAARLLGIRREELDAAWQRRVSGHARP